MNTAKEKNSNDTKKKIIKENSYGTSVAYTDALAPHVTKTKAPPKKSKIKNYYWSREPKSKVIIQSAQRI